MLHMFDIFLDFLKGAELSISLHVYKAANIDASKWQSPRGESSVAPQTTGAAGHVEVMLRRSAQAARAAIVGMS